MTSTIDRYVLLVLFIVCLLGIGRDLWTPDEPREAEISREMMVSPGVVPSLNGETFIEKPPLYYWVVAAASKLTGGASIIVARSISAIPAFLTLLIVYLWGRKNFSGEVGLTASVGLATSIQFMVSSHWVMMDSLLMLFTTIAAWAAAERLRTPGNTRALILFYLALLLALWTKGLIGPVLIAAGLLMYLVLQKSMAPIWSLRPFTGIVVITLGIVSIAGLIYWQSGYDALHEWFWVNQVQRLTNPTYTGHKQPFYYYLTAVPVAVFPWWLPFFSLFRPTQWRASTQSGYDSRRYLASLVLAMFIILSIASTKRSVYLLPLLPPLFLLMADQAIAWWNTAAGCSLKGWGWWLQVFLLLLFCLLPVLVVAVYYLHTMSLWVIVYWVLVAILFIFLLYYSRKKNRGKVLATLMLCAVTGVAGVFPLSTHLLAEPVKDMTPFVKAMIQQMPLNREIYAMGEVDETLLGIVGYVSGERVIETNQEKLRQQQPRCVIVQDKNGGKTAPLPKGGYRLTMEKKFGPGRYMALWCR